MGPHHGNESDGIGRWREAGQAGGGPEDAGRSDDFRAAENCESFDGSQPGCVCVRASHGSK
eukprot:scaffold601038_cov39-Prasinocladus_malaysianus.AAC.1